MKTIFLARHAKSSWEAAGLRDIERPLNERGLSDAPLMADIFLKEEGRPDLIATSPAVRANTTGQIFAEKLGIDKTHILIIKEIYDAYSIDIIDIIENLNDKYQKVMLFGHNPTFTDVANMFDGGEDLYNLPTCGIVKIVSDAQTWETFSGGKPKVVATYFPRDYRD